MGFRLLLQITRGFSVFDELAQAGSELRMRNLDIVCKGHKQFTGFWKTNIQEDIRTNSMKESLENKE